MNIGTEDRVCRQIWQTISQNRLAVNYERLKPFDDRVIREMRMGEQNQRPLEPLCMQRRTRFVHLYADRVRCPFRRTDIKKLSEVHDATPKRLIGSRSGLFRNLPFPSETHYGSALRPSINYSRWSQRKEAAVAGFFWEGKWLRGVGWGRLGSSD